MRYFWHMAILRHKPITADMPTFLLHYWMINVECSCGKTIHVTG